MWTITNEYRKLVAGIRSEWRACGHETVLQKKIAFRFHVLYRCSARLCKAIGQYEFCSDEEEIRFFRTMKPALLCELAYYQLLYFSVVFCPEVPRMQQAFWQRETERLVCFKEKNSAFYEYYISGRTDMDHEYFLRPRSRGAGPETETKYALLIGELWAVERYCAYARRKLSAHTKAN
jgi:hypothetical protein